MFPTGHALSNDKGSTCQPLNDVNYSVDASAASAIRCSLCKSVPTSNNPLFFRSVYCFQYCPSCPTNLSPPSPQAFGHALLLWTISTKCLGGNTYIMVCASHTCYFGHLAYHCMFMFLGLKDLCDLPCGLFADRWDAFCNCPSRQLVDSMCKSVEVVQKSHTVVRILPEVEWLDMLPKTDPVRKQLSLSPYKSE